MRKSLLLLSLHHMDLFVLTSSSGAGSSGQFLLFSIEASYCPFSKEAVFLRVQEKSPTPLTVPFLQMPRFTLTKAGCLSSSSSTGRATAAQLTPTVAEARSAWKRPLNWHCLTAGSKHLQRAAVALLCSPNHSSIHKAAARRLGRGNAFTPILFCSAAPKGEQDGRESTF